MEFGLHNSMGAFYVRGVEAMDGLHCFGHIRKCTILVPPQFVGGCAIRLPVLIGRWPDDALR
jgi:hypothetical protein